MPNCCKGVLMSPSLAGGDLQIFNGEDALTTYEFNARMPNHSPCKLCGIHPFFQTPIGPAFWHVDIGCLEDADPNAEVGLVNGTGLALLEAA
jgi:hypothetical protein